MLMCNRAWGIRRATYALRLASSHCHLFPFAAVQVSHSSTATPPKSALFEALHSHDRDSTAVVHSFSQQSFTYGTLLHDIVAAKSRLASQSEDDKGIQGSRIAFLIENGYDYVVHLLAIIASNAIAVPLAPSFPPSELYYNVDHAKANLLLASPENEKLAQKVIEQSHERAIRAVPCGDFQTSQEDQLRDQDLQLEKVKTESGGMMLYTSGTTSRPKGVLLPTSVLEAQVQSLCQAWQYSQKDRLLHVLPLHHIHGTVNAVLAPLYAGSTIEFLYPFSTEAVFRRFARPFLPAAKKDDQPVTFFTAVPTIYHRLLGAHGNLDKQTKDAVSTALGPDNLRLNISGSAALPLPTKEAWSSLSSGNTLLERYGMTEVGMALSCGLAHCDRIDGSVGWPLPSVQARLIDTETDTVVPEDSEAAGEIQLTGPTIFKEYWRNPEATAAEFTRDGWFKTGDVAYRKTMPAPIGTGESGAWAKGPTYFIQGRQSSDIIKSGGEKISALEIEREMLSLPTIEECAIVGVPSTTWGQKVAAVVVLSEEGRSAGKGGKATSTLDLRRALKDRLAAYKIPQEMLVVDTIPRNAMGKINKRQLVKDMFGDESPR